MTRVLLVDDDPRTCAHLEAVLTWSDDIEVAGQAHDGSEAVRRARHLRPDVVLLDLRMPLGDGLDAIAPLTEMGCSVVVLTAFDTDRDVEIALRRGAVGYVLKSGDPAELVHVVRTAQAGHHVLAPPVVRHLTGQARDEETLAQMIRRALSTRELQTAQALAAGMSNAQIATELGITVPTVKGHVSALVRKLGCESRLQVGLLVRDAGLDRY